MNRRQVRKEAIRLAADVVASYDLEQLYGNDLYEQEEENDWVHELLENLQVKIVATIRSLK